MKRRMWYNIALYLPIIVPVVVCGLIWAGEQLSGTSWTTPTKMGEIYRDTIIGEIDGALLLQIAFGGIQYLIFTMPIVYWGQHKDEYQIFKISWLLPLLYAPVCAAGIFLITIINYIIFSPSSHHPPRAMQEDIKTSLALGSISIIYGYFYVLLAHGLTWLLQKAGIVRD